MATKAELWREIEEITKRIETNNAELYIKHNIQKNVCQYRADYSALRRPFSFRVFDRSIG